MKIPIGKHGNITQTMPNDTSARARRARSSYKFKNATSPWREWRYPMKNPMNRKYFWLPGSVEGGRRSLPSLGRSQWSASSKRGETARPKRSKLPKMGALARMAVKRTKTVSKPPHRAPRVRGASGHPPHPFSAKVVMERENPIFGPLVAPLRRISTITVWEITWHQIIGRCHTETFDACDGCHRHRPRKRASTS